MNKVYKTETVGLKNKKKSNNVAFNQDIEHTIGQKFSVDKQKKILIK